MFFTLGMLLCDFFTLPAPTQRLTLTKTTQPQMQPPAGSAQPPQTHFHTEQGPTHLVEEDAPKVVPVGKHIRLAGQVGTTRVDKIEAGQLAGLSYLLQPQVLLQGQQVGIMGRGLGGEV